MNRRFRLLAILSLGTVLLCATGCADLGEAWDKAKEQDDRKRYEKTVWCPECGSTRKTQTGIGKVGNVLGHGMLYKCKKCGHKYQ